MTHSCHDTGDTNSLEVGQACHIGLVRSLNEDRVLTLSPPLTALPKGEILALFAVADGIGGCEGGEIAGDLALGAMSEGISEALAGSASEEHSAGRDQAGLRTALTEGVRKANRMVFDHSQATGSDMGTTMVAALVSGNCVHIANVGDSRAYLLKEGDLSQVTTDHSLVASLVLAGLITHDEVYTHPQRNIITRSVGMGPGLEVDLYTEELCPGSTLLLCSDGLWEMVKEDQMKSILLQSPCSQVACDQLVEAANQNGGVDNISVIVVRRKSGAEDR